MKALSLVDIAVLAVYLAAMVGVGLWFGRKNRTPDQFMKAGGAIPGWAVGLSIFGTYVSSISFLALPGKAYAGNWNAFVFSLTIPLTAWIAVRWFVPFYRRSGEISAYAHLEKRFGPWARTYAVLCYLLMQLGRMGTIMYLLAVALKPLTGMSVTALILVTGAIVVVYTLVGGMAAVIWTDVVQSVVLIAGALACVAVLLIGMPQGPEQFIQLAMAQDKLSLGSLEVDLLQATVWVVLLNGLFINLQNFGIDQNYVQRYATARSDSAAARSVWLGALLYLPISAVFFLIGTLLYVFYAVHPDILPLNIKPDEIFPHFITTGLPIGLGGLVVAAIFAAAQSTLSSSINGSATLTLCDLYRRYLRPEASEQESMWVLRTATLFFGFAGTFTAFAMVGVESALDSWWAIASISSGGMLGLFLLGIVSRASNAAAATATTVGVLTIVWMTISAKWPAAMGDLAAPFHSFMITVIGTLTILLVGLAVSRISTLFQPAFAARSNAD
jgi:SSS family solute:Na+ symporter